MPESVRTLHGATSMPATRNDPLEMAAPRSFGECTTLARSRTSCTDRSVSWLSVAMPDLVITRCVSTPASASRSSARIPYTAPEAPVIATTTRVGSAMEPGLQHVQQCSQPTGLANHGAHLGVSLTGCCRRPDGGVDGQLGGAPVGGGGRVQTPSARPGHDHQVRVCLEPGGHRPADLLVIEDVDVVVDDHHQLDRRKG